MKEEGRRFGSGFKTQEELEAAIKTNPRSVGAVCPPKSSCKKCYGRGYIGKEAGTSRFIACSCVFKVKRKP